jgi:hypothetical protein
MIEFVILATSILTITVYILFCKIFISLKILFNQVDKNDPFIKSIQNNSSDFIEADNFFITMWIPMI